MDPFSLQSLLEVASSLGAEVYEADLRPRVVAYAVPASPLPRGLAPGRRAAVFVSRALPPAQKRLAIAHALGHVALGHLKEEGWTDLSGGRSFPDDPERERQATRFALELLMPERAFRQAWEALAPMGLQHVAALFGVTANAVALRAEELGLEAPL